jgi:uncharacterized LabA/DUF88 family protein
MGMYRTNIENVCKFKQMKRVNFYIDGFNLYFGMADAGYNHCKWLDIEKLANTLKNSTQTLHKVKYFTSRINNNFQKQQRQNAYLNALSTTSVEIIYGEFRTNWMNCKTCGNGWYDSKEKKTDVNIAVNLVLDAHRDDYDVAIIISGDSDLVPGILAVKEMYPAKEIRVAFPPTHQSNDLKKAADGSFTIGRQKLEISLLPEEITDKYGDKITRPISWI